VSFLNFTALHPQIHLHPSQPSVHCTPKTPPPHPNKKQIPSLCTLHALHHLFGIFDLASHKAFFSPSPPLQRTHSSPLLPHSSALILLPFSPTTAHSFSLFSHKPFFPRHPFLLFSSTHNSSPHRGQPSFILSRGFSIFAGK